MTNKEILQIVMQQSAWNMHWLGEWIAPLGQKICFMAEYFLPDVNKLKRLECNYELRVLGKEDFADLYLRG